MKNHTYVFRSPGVLNDPKIEVAVDLWETGEVQVKVRGKPTDIWSVPLTLVREEGDPVQIAFEREDLDDLFEQKMPWPGVHPANQGPWPDEGGS